jgi:hypothetical protein
MEETQSRHRKELKTLEGEKRAALKKAKGTKGKKAKEVLKACVQDACFALLHDYTSISYSTVFTVYITD